MPLGFFLSVMSPGAQKPNGLIALVYVGAPPSYSSRSTRAGSTRATRRAGIKAASSAAPLSNKTAPPMASGSCGRIP
jgi:hypothetical protein